MQAICPEQPPRSASARWGRVGTPPKPFARSETVLLLHSECGQLSQERTCLHLFSAKVAATGPFERRTVLSDWRFSVQVAGVILLLDRQGESNPRRWFWCAPKVSANRTLAWVREQNLPFVIAAMGYESANFSEGSFRQHYGLTPQVPIMPGPAIAQSYTSSIDFRSMFGRGERSPISCLVGGGNLRFDSVYAGRVLSVLLKAIATQCPSTRTD